jgi:hypothetical protein
MSEGNLIIRFKNTDVVADGDMCGQTLRFARVNRPGSVDPNAAVAQARNFMSCRSCMCVRQSSQCHVLSFMYVRSAELFQNQSFD